MNQQRIIHETPKSRGFQEKSPTSFHRSACAIKILPVNSCSVGLGPLRLDHQTGEFVTTDKDVRGAIIDRLHYGGKHREED